MGYFTRSADHMRCRDYREQHLFIGSGVVEAACRHPVGSRLKQSCMEWTVHGANNIPALSSVVPSGRMDDYWEKRATA